MTTPTAGLDPAPTTPEATEPVLPPMARVAVLVGNRQIDVSLPATVQLRVVMEDLVELLKNRGAQDFTLPAGRAWTLSRIGGDPIARSSTLDGEGIVDGDLLALRQIRGSERFVPIDEEVSEALALMNDRKFANFGATTARHGAMVATLLTSVTVAVLLYLAWRTSTWPWWVPMLSGALGVGAWLLAATLGSRSKALTPLRWFLFVASLPPLMCAGVTATPSLDLPRGAGGANLLLGSVVVFVAAFGFRWLTQGATMVVTAVTAASGVLGIAGLLATVTPLSVHAVAAVVVVIAILGLTNAPKITISLAGVKPPDLPAPGDPVRPDTLDKDSQLERRARTANKYLTGLILALSGCLSIASVVAIDPHTYHAVPAIIVAAVVAALLFLRGRSYIDRVQCLTLYTAAVATAVGCAAVVVVSYPSPGAQAAAVAGFLAGMGVAITAALRGPGSKMSPPKRKMIEILEFTLICVSLPLALWVTGIYGLLRDL